MTRDAFSFLTELESDHGPSGVDDRSDVCPVCWKEFAVLSCSNLSLNCSNLSQSSSTFPFKVDNPGFGVVLPIASILVSQGSQYHLMLLFVEPQFLVLI